jgi:hypothetical protein
MTRPAPAIFLFVTALVAVLVNALASACSPASSAPSDPANTSATTPARTPFIAFARDFQVFRAWERIDLPSERHQGLTHVAGKRREYLSQRPPPGATQFPVGTILVKELVGAASSGHGLFAMVKRGGDYNRAGARGWEWFELGEREGSVGIVWRGLNAPDGEGYGSGDPLGGCNGCHDVGAANDYVRGPVPVHRR